MESDSGVGFHSKRRLVDPSDDEPAIRTARRAAEVRSPRKRVSMTDLGDEGVERVRSAYGGKT
jgi:hypothetical protein